MEQTLMMIKPDAVRRNLVGEILRRVESAGLKIVRLRMVHLKRSEAEEFYQVHAERPFFGQLVEFMASGPIVVGVLEAESAISRWRETMGATDPAKAEPGSIRRDLAVSLTENSVHGSDGPDTAGTEIDFFDLGMELHG